MFDNLNRPQSAPLIITSSNDFMTRKTTNKNILNYFFTKLKKCVVVVFCKKSRVVKRTVITLYFPFLSVNLMISIGREIQAFRIDEAFKEILKGGLIDITQEVPGLYHQAMPEIDAIMDIVYYLYSTKADGVLLYFNSLGY